MFNLKQFKNEQNKGNKLNWFRKNGWIIHTILSSIGLIIALIALFHN